MKYWDAFYPFIIHEYALVFYGVVLWEIQQHFTKPKITLRERFNYIGRSMIWGGLIVVFDDEIADLLLEHTSIDLYNDLGPNAGNIEWYFYFGTGFLIDIIRIRVTKN